MQTAQNNLAQAMALLVQNQAAFVAQSFEQQKWRAEADQRFAHIERTLEEIKAILTRHERILTQLPEAVRRIGFKGR